MTDSWRWPTVGAWPAPHHIPMIYQICCLAWIRTTITSFKG